MTTSHAIYSPPKKGLPYLIVTMANGEITAYTAAQSRAEARLIIASRQGGKPKTPTNSR
jgi:hypothetical protein